MGLFPATDICPDGITLFLKFASNLSNFSIMR